MEVLQDQEAWQTTQENQGQQSIHFGNWKKNPESRKRII